MGLLSVKKLLLYTRIHLQPVVAKPCPLKPFDYPCAPVPLRPCGPCAPVPLCHYAIAPLRLPTNLRSSGCRDFVTTFLNLRHCAIVPLRPCAPAPLRLPTNLRSSGCRDFVTTFLNLRHCAIVPLRPCAPAPLRPCAIKPSHILLLISSSDCA